MGHFSRFVEPDSVRILAKVDRKTSLEYIAFETRSNALVLVILNRQPKSFTIHVSEASIGDFVHKIPPRSIQTFKWNSAA